MARFLVTGGAGFIGSHLVDSLLAQNHAVRVLDNLSTGKCSNVAPAAEFVHGDTTNYSVVQKAVGEIDGIFHLAAVASVEKAFEDWPGTHRDNVMGFINVLDASRRVGPKPIPIIYASSAAVYGDDGGRPLGEDAPTVPVSAYGADKLGCERHAHVGAVAYGIPSVGLRLFNVYGPRQIVESPYSSVISIFCDCVNSGKEICIHGDGLQTRDFIFVSDVVRLLIKTMQSRPSGSTIYNACTGTATSILALADHLWSLSGRPRRIVHGPSQPGHIRFSVGDATQANKQFQWKAAVSLTEGLARLMSLPQPADKGRHVSAREPAPGNAA